MIHLQCDYDVPGCSSCISLRRTPSCRAKTKTSFRCADFNCHLLCPPHAAHPFSLSLTHTQCLSRVLVVMKTKELKTKISLTHSRFSLLPTAPISSLPSPNLSLYSYNAETVAGCVYTFFKSVVSAVWRLLHLVENALLQLEAATQTFETRKRLQANEIKKQTAVIVRAPLALRLSDWVCCNAARAPSHTGCL